MHFLHILSICVIFYYSMNLFLTIVQHMYYILYKHICRTCHLCYCALYSCICNYLNRFLLYLLCITCIYVKHIVLSASIVYNHTPRLYRVFVFCDYALHNYYFCLIMTYMSLHMCLQSVSYL